MSSADSADVQRFLDKLDELRAVFVLGRRSLPFVEELFRFVQDITVLLEEVNTTIRTRTGHMRKAKEQLESVSEATEMATSEILDHTDQMLSDLNGLESAIEDSLEESEGLAAADEKLFRLLERKLSREGHGELLDEIESLKVEKQELRQERTNRLEDAKDTLSSVRQQVHQITMSLQVQDITEQQLESVNHLIETVRGRIGTLLDNLGTGEAGESDMPGGAPGRTSTFNAGARYNRDGSHQDLADGVVRSMGGPDSKDGHDTETPEGFSSSDDESAGGLSPGDSPSTDRSPGDPSSADASSGSTAPEGSSATREKDITEGAEEESENQSFSSERATQSDIDDMFSRQSGRDAPSDDTSGEDTSGNGEGETGQSSSSDGKKSSGSESVGGEKASQDEIDELFED